MSELYMDELNRLWQESNDDMDKYLHRLHQGKELIILKQGEDGVYRG